jgi:hypothetical protein
MELTAEDLEVEGAHHSWVEAKAALEKAVQHRASLAARLYAQHGPERTYWVDGVEMLVSPTKPRADGSVGFFFAEKYRWHKPRRAKPPTTEAGLVIVPARYPPKAPKKRYPQPKGAKKSKKNERAKARYVVIGPNPVPSGVPRAVESVHPMFRSLPPEELAAYPVPSDTEIKGAIEQGQRDAAAFLAARRGQLLPSAPKGRVIEATAVLDGRALAGAGAAPDVNTDDMDLQAGGRGMSLEEAVERYPEAASGAVEMARALAAGAKQRPKRRVGWQDRVTAMLGEPEVLSERLAEGQEAEIEPNEPEIGQKTGKIHLPLLKEGAPEPRLLQIAQPAGVRTLIPGADGAWLVPLTQEQTAIVDEEDALFVGRWNWQAHQVTQTRGTDKALWYGRRYVERVEGRQICELMHRAIAARFLPLTDDLDVDHKNHNGLDNRRANLRLATRTQNLGNLQMRSTNTSGYKGVSWDEASGQWRAQITEDGKRVNLGRYNTPEEAHAAYMEASNRVYGEFSNPVTQEPSQPPTGVSTEPEDEDLSFFLDEFGKPGA